MAPSLPDSASHAMLAPACSPTERVPSHDELALRSVVKVSGWHMSVACKTKVLLFDRVQRRTTTLGLRDRWVTASSHRRYSPHGIARARAARDTRAPLSSLRERAGYAREPRHRFQRGNQGGTPVRGVHDRVLGRASGHRLGAPGAALRPIPDRDDKSDHARRNHWARR
jgi:hypothetical protein